MSDFLGDLVALARHNVKVRALMREFCDSGRVIARCEIDLAATVATGNVVTYSESSDEFGRALAAVLAKDAVTDDSGMAHGRVASHSGF
jgi:hypothetical protein